MSTRKNTILTSIVEEFVATSDPVGSKVMAEFLGFSPATIRGEMARLEKEGLICQPLAIIMCTDRQTVKQNPDRKGSGDFQVLVLER